MGAGGAVVNANTALAALKNDTASAGLGFFGDSRFLCNKLNLSVNASVLADAADFAPVRITHADSGDTVDVIYGTRVESGANVLLGAASDGSSAETLSLLPVSVGQAVLVAPDVPGNPCVVRSVTAVTAATDTTRQQLVFANAGKHNAAAFSAAMSFPEKGRVALLGELRWNRYRLSNGNLVLERPLEGNASAVLARNVVAFQAQYGVSANVANSTTLEGWQEATGTDFGSLDGDAIARVRAMRLGLVTRSPGQGKAQQQRPVRGQQRQAPALRRRGGTRRGRLAMLALSHQRGGGAAAQPGDGGEAMSAPGRSQARIPQCAARRVAP